MQLLSPPQRFSALLLLFTGWQQLLFHPVDKTKEPAQMHLLLKRILPIKNKLSLQRCVTPDGRIRGGESGWGSAGDNQTMPLRRASGIFRVLTPLLLLRLFLVPVL